jgi:predicted permease
MWSLHARLRSVFRRSTVDREMRDEMQTHLDRATERLIARGMSKTDARSEARREFGNVAALQEEARDIRGARWIETLSADVRYALRHFARTPLTAITLILVLSLGIGVNSALFSILRALTMRPAPGVPNDPALIRVRGTTLARTEGVRRSRLLSMPELNDLATRRGTFSAVAGYAIDQIVLDPGDGANLRPDEVHFVTPNYFSTLRVQPVMGPGLPGVETGDTPGAELVAVMSHLQWERLGGDSSIIGRVVRVNSVPVRVVGVAPVDFEGPVIESGTPAVWMPLASRAAIMKTTAHALVSRDSTFLDAFARLAQGASIESANALVPVVARAWAPESPRGGEAVTYSSDVVRLRGFTDVANDREVLLVASLFAVGALLVLLVACTNVSALLVGAAVARRREIAIRLSLGASRLRVVRQLVTETALIALAGGAVGLFLFWVISRVIASVIGSGKLAPDAWTVAFTAVVALGTGIIFGLSPALHATRLDVSHALKDSGGGGTSRSRLQRIFIVAQIVLTQPLLVAIAMVIAVVISETAGRVTTNRLADQIVRVQFGTYGGIGSPDAKRVRIAEMMERVAALPGVEAVVPKATVSDIADFRVHSADRGDGTRAQETVRTEVDGTPPGYFAFQGIKMLGGREFVANDTASADLSVVVTSDLARGFWGAENPIGKRLQMIQPEMTIVDGDKISKREQQPPKTAVVIGVFDTTGTPLRSDAQVYSAQGSRWDRDTYLIRSRTSGLAVIPDVRRLAREMIPDIQLYGSGLATLEQLERDARKEVLQVSGLATGAGVLALLLASIGLYGLVSLGVRQRHREIGIRVALGARPRTVIGLFFLTGVRLGLFGVVLGLPLSVLALQYIASQFSNNFSFNMPVVGAAIAVTVVAVASLASWLPARRAAGVDPLVAIRTE